MNWIKGILLLLVAACVPAANTYARPNIIFVMADDLGYGDLSCYGQEAILTANLDLMAAEGMRFTQAYAGCTVCAPSRGALMTGMHMGHASVRSNTGGVPLLDADITVADVLKKAGYATGGFGKWGLGDLDSAGAPEKQGFDRFFGYYHQIHAHTYYPDYLIDTGKKVPLPGNKDFHKNNKGQGGMPELNGEQAAEFSHARIKQEMFDWIRAKKDRSFYCYAPWTLPHARHEMPVSDPAWQSVKDKPWSDEAKGHAAFTIMVDRDMGELFALLRELGIDDNTVVFFCSDNGADERYEGELDSCGPFQGKKGSLYEGGLRVPLIVRWPGTIDVAQTAALPVYFPDVLPTLAQLAGAESGLPEDLDGLSFVPTLFNRRELQLMHDALYWEHTPVNWSEGGKLEPEKTAQAIRIGTLKGIRDRFDAPIELYDLASDPGESIDLADSNPEIVKVVTQALEDMRTDFRPQPEPKLPDGMKYR